MNILQLEFYSQQSKFMANIGLLSPSAWTMLTI